MSLLDDENIIDKEFYINTLKSKIVIILLIIFKVGGVLWNSLQIF